MKKTINKKSEIEHVDNVSPTTGYNQLTTIIGEIMAAQTFPMWNFTNNVLSCDKILGDFNLWFHWGHLLIVNKADRYKTPALTAAECERLDDWNTEADGTITLIGKRWTE